MNSSFEMFFKCWIILGVGILFVLVDHVEGGVKGGGRRDEAGLEIHQYWPLVELGCSDDLKPFLCLLYVPRCEEGILKPCFHAGHSVSEQGLVANQ
ncbi:Frizzled-8 [Orchesella cincta]|uniref:Frizzled-8 n=1 Tax=Orchesella cincta TaxID=48709 RepID=A0A1D2MBI2_ORCCI|nr:Frizzled-8 [Orchesella cincta]